MSATLVVQPLPGIGDMVWHLSLIHAIAAATPSGRVSILTKPRSQADRLLAADPAVASVLWLQRNPGIHDGPAGLVRLAAMLRRQAFQQVWVLHDSSRYAFAAWLAGIPARHGYGVGSQRLWLNGGTGLPRTAWRDHPIRKAEEFRQRSALPRVDEEPRLVVDEQASESIQAGYAALPRPWVALGVGSSEPYKQWGAERFSALARTLLEDRGGSVFIVGGDAERPLGAAILNVAGPVAGSMHAFLGMPLEQTAALLAASDLYIGNDTGVLNMAAAVGIPSIGLFGGSEPLWHARNLQGITGRDMPSIGVSVVLDAAQSALAGGVE